jgi:hypothetical protein
MIAGLGISLVFGWKLALVVLGMAPVSPVTPVMFWNVILPVSRLFSDVPRPLFLNSVDFCAGRRDGWCIGVSTSLGGGGGEHVCTHHSDEKAAVPILKGTWALENMCKLFRTELLNTE